MIWDEAVNQHVSMWKAKEANVPRSMTSVCTYDDCTQIHKLHKQSETSAFCEEGQ